MLYIKTKKLTKKSRTYAACRGFFLYSTVKHPGREVQLMEQDVGRSFQIFAHSFPEEDIIKDAKDVLKNLVPIDREVTAMNGRYYTLRIAPYRTTENSIRGLVITIIDSLGAQN